MNTVVIDYTRPDPGLAITIAQVVARRSAVHIFNVSSQRSLLAASAAARTVAGQSIGFLHGGGLVTALRPGVLRRRRTLKFDELWVTNEVLARAAHELLQGALPVSIVSPYVSRPTVTEAADRTGQTTRFVAFAYRGEKLYGLDLCLEAVCQLRQRLGEDLRLTLVVYGASRATEWATTAATASAAPWVDVLEDLSQEQVDAVLGGTDTTLLRPTSTDGDSLTVRRALALGTRVIASSAVPRPTGVELCGRDVQSLMNSITDGGERATGEGLGTSVGVVLTQLLER